MEKEDIKKMVRERYGAIASQDSCGCGCGPDCCGIGNTTADAVSRGVGYSDAEMVSVPEGANLGLGCGNPVALASLAEGETVVDLGSGAGFDCFLAAERVGKNGRVIGVDMTAEMLAKASGNCARGGYTNVEFRLGEIENLPVADGLADAVISNCVVNLSPDKPQVFKEVFRVLKPGGRMMVSDIVLLKTLPEFIRNSAEAYAGCVAGAMLMDDYLTAINTAGFSEVNVVDDTSFPVEYLLANPVAQSVMTNLSMTPEEIKNIVLSVRSIKVSAVKSK
ncbi:arsenite methyltransferase [Chloroflexota bacterium]